MNTHDPEREIDEVLEPQTHDPDDEVLESQIGANIIDALMEHLPDLEIVTRAIERGKYDGNFGDIEKAMEARRLKRKSEVMAQVKEVFGSDAKISFENHSEDENPFVKRAKQPIVATDHSRDEIERLNEELSDGPTPDPLESNTMDNLEQRMISEGAALEVPIERRGAIISGLSSSDIEG